MPARLPPARAPTSSFSTPTRSTTSPTPVASRRCTCAAWWSTAPSRRQIDMATRDLLLVLGVMTAVSCTRSAAPPPAAGSAVPFPAGELVDLSHTYDQTTIFWPTASPFALEKVADGETPAGFYYSANNFS